MASDGMKKLLFVLSLIKVLETCFYIYTYSQNLLSLLPKPAPCVESCLAAECPKSCTRNNSCMTCRMLKSC